MIVSSTTDTLRVVDILDGTSVDGPGLRTSIYLAGCRHACPGCHNPSTWAFDAGIDMTIDEIMERIKYNDFNVTLSGGDPIYQAKALQPLLQAIKGYGKSVWLYTGFTYEELCRMPDATALFPYIDAIVDGPFIESRRDTALRFRGSSNQRIINPATGSLLEEY